MAARSLRSSAAALAAFAVLTLLSAARADDPKTHVLPRKSVWHVGDVVTTTTNEAETKKTRQSPANGPEAPEVSTDTKVTAVTVSKCLAASEDGAWTKVLVYVKSWTREQGEKRDESLAGARIEVTGQGRDATWALAPDAAKPSKEASDWLDKHYGAKSTDETALRKSLLSVDPVAVGASWTGDPAPMFATSSLGAAADLAKATIKATLEAVDGNVARVAFEIRLPLKSLPGVRAGMESSWTKGGVYESKGEVTLDLDGSSFVTSTSQQGRLEGEASISTPAGLLVLSASVSASTEVRIVRGGEIPEGVAPEVPKKDGAGAGGEPIPK